jgi:hypothetical protein
MSPSASSGRNDFKEGVKIRMTPPRTAQRAAPDGAARRPYQEQCQEASPFQHRSSFGLCLQFRDRILQNVALLFRQLRRIRHMLQRHQRRRVITCRKIGNPLTHLILDARIRRLKSGLQFHGVNLAIRATIRKQNQSHQNGQRPKQKFFHRLNDSILLPRPRVHAETTRISHIDLINDFSLKRWLKRTDIVLCGLASLALLFAVEEHVRGRLALNACLSRLRANGEVYSVAALEPKHPPPEQNAFLDLTNIAVQLRSIVKHYDDEPLSLWFATPGKVIVAWRLNQWAGNGKITNDWSRLGPELDKARGVLDLVHAAVQKPAYDNRFDYKKGITDLRDLYIGDARQIADTLGEATLYELHRGNLDTAAGDLCDMVKLIAIQKAQPLLECQFLRMSCASLAFQFTWQALQAPGWNDAQLAGLQTNWAGCDFFKDVASATEMQRALIIDYYEQIKASNAKLTLVTHLYVPFDNERFPAREFFQHWVQVPFWRWTWADQEEIIAQNRWTESIHRIQFVGTNDWASLPNKSVSDEIFFDLPEPKLGWYDHLRFLFMSDPFSIVDDTMIRRAVYTQVQKEMAVTAIALHRYRLQSGRFPDTLTSLVPKFLPALPRDDMDGKTLRYRLQPDGNFLLYSVGLDGKDDGGDTSPMTNGLHLNMWSSKDAVWPSPATDEEAVAAMNKKR